MLRESGPAVDWTRDLQIAGQTLYLWATMQQRNKGDGGGGVITAAAVVRVIVDQVHLMTVDSVPGGCRP